MPSHDNIRSTKELIEAGLEPPKAKTIRLRVDLAGVLDCAADVMEGKPLSVWKGEPTQDDRESYAYQLREIAKHIRMVREGSTTTQAEFADLYGLQPGAMLYGRKAGEAA